MSVSTGRRVRLDFGNLPLVEAVVRLSLETPVQLKFAIINHVADRLRNEFPRLDELSEFQLPPGIKMPAVPIAPGGILGAAYAGNPDGLIITVQSQMLAARWLRQFGQDTPDYTRFPTLRDALWRALDAFKGACGDQLPRVAVVNMSYVNFLRVAHTEPVLARYFSDLAQVKAAQGATQIHKAEVSWQESDSVDLRYRLESVTASVGDETVEGYRITTAAGVRLREAAGERAALDAVHDRLQVFFRDLISPQAKQEWQLKEVPLA